MLICYPILSNIYIMMTSFTTLKKTILNKYCYRKALKLGPKSKYIQCNQVNHIFKMLHKSNLLRFVTSRMFDLGVLLSILMRQNDILLFIGKEKNEPFGIFYQPVRGALVKQCIVHFSVSSLLLSY